MHDVQCGHRLRMLNQKKPSKFCLKTCMKKLHSMTGLGVAVGSSQLHAGVRVLP